MVAGERAPLRADADADADAVTAALVGGAPRDPTAWLTRAHVTTTDHRFPETLRALERAGSHGAAAEAVTEERADVLEAYGHRTAALGLRMVRGTDGAGPQQPARIACLYLSAGDDEPAAAAFGEALDRYADPSPFPPAAMVHNWAHALQHAGQQDRARAAYRVVLASAPTHARALRALAG